MLIQLLGSVTRFPFPLGFIESRKLLQSDKCTSKVNQMAIVSICSSSTHWYNLFNQRTLTKKIHIEEDRIT